MSKTLQLRRGTAEEHKTFIGAMGEITYNTTNKTIHVHDGSTAGGHIVARMENWGSITGDITKQEDLQSALSTKINLSDIKCVDCGTITEGVLSEYSDTELTNLISDLEEKIAHVETAINTISDDDFVFSDIFLEEDEFQRQIDECWESIKDLNA